MLPFDSTRTKQCSKCGTVKPIEDFGVEARRPDGRRCYCRSCGNTYLRAFRTTSQRYKANRKQSARKTKLRLRYGISEEAYQRMLSAQDGRCAICGTQDPCSRWGVFHVDHDHDTGAVRGLLCHPCNVMLGKFGDSKERVLLVLEKIREYVTKTSN